MPTFSQEKNYFIHRENLLSLQGSCSHCSDAASGWAGLALAHPEFGVSVNPIPTRGADYTHRITACPPGFENLAASLVCKKNGQIVLYLEIFNFKTFRVEILQIFELLIWKIEFILTLSDRLRRCGFWLDRGRPKYVAWK